MKKPEPKTANPPPTSPHEFHQVAIPDIVAQVTDVDSIFAFANLGELQRLFWVCIDRTTEGARELA
jgi:hypothetical protein